MNPDLDTLATRLYVMIDDLMIAHPAWAPERPAVGIAPQLSDAELVTLAVIQALLGFTSEARFIRYARAHLRPWFPYLPDRSGYNKRLRRAVGLMRHITAALARACLSWHDDVWLVDSTPVECGRSRETAKRSALAGWAEYGYCASHSRYFWGLRLHLITTPSGLPIAFGLTGAKTDERDVCLELITDTDTDLTGQILIADKGYRRATFETELNTTGITLIRPALRGEAPRPGQRFLRPLRQIIESVNQTLKAQLDLERHGGRTKPGVCARVLQRILALTATIWHNETSDQPRPARHLTPYDH
jgi:Transposase DDE domain